MKNNMVKVLTFFLMGILLCSCLAGCGSEGKTHTKEQVSASSSKDGKEVVKGFYVNEETGEIINASTGEAVKDGSVKVDEKTGDIVDGKTGEVIETKKEAEEVKKATKKKPKAEANSKDNKKHKEEKKAEKKEESKPAKEETKKPSKSPASDKKDTDKATSKAPTSNKKVTFNKDKLYKKMVSIYKEPNYIKEPTKNEFSHEIRGKIPGKVKKVFDWYLNVMDTGRDTETTITAEEYQLFIETWPTVLNFTSNVNYRDNRDGTVSLQVTQQMINEGVERCYKDYCKQVQAANAPAKQQYDSYIAKAKQACDMVEKAVTAVNIQGKDEVTAVNSIIDYICKNCTYWNEAVGMPADQHKGEWICDCLGDHHAVCNGYAKTFYAMCYYAGIDVTYYWGYTDKREAHAWNSVKVNGKDYYFDITWHDSMVESGSTKDTYIWAGNAEFSKEHMKKGTDITFW